MKFCHYCGAEMDDGDNFCPKCGRSQWQKTAAPEPPKFRREPKNALMCELAYSGALFWLPLVFCPDEPDARFHANEGLWLLILSVLSCTAIRLLSVVNDSLAGVASVLFSGLYAIAFLVFLAVMLYLLLCAVTRAMAISRGEEPRPILFFGRAAIIK